MKNKGYSILTIDHQSKISTALQQMDKIGRKLLIVTCGGLYFSMLSIGDIQRAIIKGVPLDASIKEILRDQVKVAKAEDDLEQIKASVLQKRNEYMPVISKTGVIEKVLFWEDLFQAGEKPMKKKLTTPVVIMAGGIGSRLRPLTNVLPKALIPIGEKSILEQIMDSFLEYGCKEYYLSINHKAEMIKYYFKDLEGDYGKIHYVQEEDFWGTAGSIALINDRIKETFFVSNCDIMVDQDYADILDYHVSHQNEITVVVALLNVKIPYGVLNTDGEGQLESLSEKPELFYKINTGLYVLEPSVLLDIPSNTVFHITDLIELLVSQRRKVGVFPVSEKSWNDMVNWDEFLKQANIKQKQ